MLYFLQGFLADPSLIVYAARAPKKANGRYLETVRDTGVQAIYLPVNLPLTF